MIAWEILGPDAPFTPVPIVEGETGRPVEALSGQLSLPTPAAPPQS